MHIDMCREIYICVCIYMYIQIGYIRNRCVYLNFLASPPPRYVGELCRFLLHASTSEHERSHSVRLAFGNGMRPDVWPRFVKRYGVFMNRNILNVYRIIYRL